MSDVALGDARLALPRWAYLPGRGGEPDREALDCAKALVPARFDAFVPADNAAFRYGLTLHDAGCFWEAHEIWEAVWMAAPMNGRDRIALRALIQIANAGLKRRIDRLRAASRLIDEADALLGELVARGAETDVGGIADRLRAAALRDELRHWAEGHPVRLAEFVTQEDAEKCRNAHEMVWTCL